MKTTRQQKEQSSLKHLSKKIKKESKHIAKNEDLHKSHSDGERNHADK
jgi:hypothetical protein